MSVPSFSASKNVNAPFEKPGSDSLSNSDDVQSQILSSTEQPQTTKQIKKKREKKIKDPTAPKRPLSAFFVFSKEQRPLMLAELGNMTVGEQGKELGRRWTSLDQQQKQKYEESVKDEWFRYREEIKAYQPSTEFLEKKAKLSSTSNFSMKSINDGVEPYFSHLMNSWRALSLARPDLSGKQIQDLVWNSWVSNMSDLMSTCQVKKVKDSAEPEKPKSGFHLSVDSHRLEVKNDNPGMDLKKINQSSKECGEKMNIYPWDVRRPYIQQPEDLNVKYQEHIES